MATPRPHRSAPDRAIRWRRAVVALLLPGTLAVGGGLAAGGAGQPAAARTVAAGSPAADAAALAAGWMAGQLSDGAAVEPFGPGVADWGLTIDTMWALMAQGDRPGLVRRMGAAVEGHVADFATGDGWSRPGRYRFAGPMAKQLLAAASLGRDPAAFGGYDVRAETLALVAGPGAGSQHGRLRDKGGLADSSNLFGQSLAVLGLARTATCAAGSGACTGSAGVPAPMVSYLLRQQCSAGYFRLVDDDGRGCDAGGGRPDTDATAMAVEALAAVRSLHPPSAEVDAAARRAVDHLQDAQRPDGSFGGGVSTPEPNSNSTGLAGMVLRAAGRDCPAAAAAAWVASVQVDPARATGPLASDLGAIAYDPAELSAARTDPGGPAGHRATWARTTPQAVFAFLPTRLGAVGDPSAAPSPEHRCAGSPPTPTPTVTPTVTPTPSATPTVTPTPTVAPTATPTTPPRATRPAAAGAPAPTSTAVSISATTPIPPALAAGPPPRATATPRDQPTGSPPGPAPGTAPATPSPARSNLVTAARTGTTDDTSPWAGLAAAILLGVLAGAAAVAWQLRRGTSRP